MAVAQAADPFGNAEMLERLGVGRSVPMDRADAATLRAAVLALVADPEVGRRLAAVQREMAAEGGTRRAADLIEAELPAGCR